MVFSKKKRYVPLLSLILSSLLAMTIPMTATAAAVSNFNSDFKYREFFSKYEYTVSSGGSGSATITGDDKNVISLTATGTGSGGCATGSDTIVTLTAKEAISITCTMKDITSCDMTADTSGSKTFDLAAGGTVSFTLHSGNSTQKSGTVTFSNVEASATKVPNDCAFYSNGSDSYAYLDEAIAAAQGGNDKTIVVTKNGTVYHSSYEKKDSNNGNYTKSFTIPDGITLLVPYDSGGTVVRDSPTTVGDDGLFDGLTGAKDEPHTAPYAYRTLTLAEDTELTINGSMSIAGKIYASDGGEIAGVPNGPVGFVNMNADSEIIVNGNLYVWGYITGSGSVTANSGSKVYENFQLAGWRGGQVTSGAENEVFPESQYYIQNIEVPLTLCAGATEIATTAVSLTGFTPVNNVNFIGPSNCMFTLSDGSITKDYIESTDRLKVDLNNATVTVSAITLESVDIGKTLKSEDYILPLTHNMTITLHSSNVICNQNLSLLPVLC